MPYDQVNNFGPLSRLRPEEAGLVLIENPGKAARRPYHKQKLALILTNLRHFALEQAQRGVLVRHVVAAPEVENSYAHALEKLSCELGPIEMMEAAEWELRNELKPLVEKGLLKISRHEGWLTDLADLEAVAQNQNGRRQYRMDAFYRRVRQRTGILMEERDDRKKIWTKPRGGKYSFDSENRQTWKGSPQAPQWPSFAVDDISYEVGELIEKHFAHHPGRLDLTAVPATQCDHDKLWQFALENCLPHFGPFEDAMSSRSRTLFHAKISASLNIHRLLPRKIIEDVLSLEIPLASQEGFIRQILGWREFVHKVHLVSEGFRLNPDGHLDIPDLNGSIDFEAQTNLETESSKSERSPARRVGTDCEGKSDQSQSQSHSQNNYQFSPLASLSGASPNFFQAVNPLPPAFWGEVSGLNCLDQVVAAVWEEAYSHHITRLMVLSNLATLLDISPRELTDWFWIAYSDAYDWVVEPNVLGMGTYSLGGFMTTKPYISGAAYINKMSDFCKDCSFDPAKTCPITRFYWAFLERHKEKLADNIRLAMPLNSLKKRSQSLKEDDRKIFEESLSKLRRGERLCNTQPKHIQKLLLKYPSDSEP